MPGALSLTLASQPPQRELAQLGGYVPPGRPAAVVVIMSYDVFRLNQAAVCGKKFELVICDEAHRLKVTGRCMSDACGKNMEWGGGGGWGGAAPQLSATATSCPCPRCSIQSCRAALLPSFPCAMRSRSNALALLSLLQNGQSKVCAWRGLSSLSVRQWRGRRRW